MRKYLLAGAAMFGAAAGMQGSAYAQTAPAPVLAAPPMGTLITPNFGKSANDNNNYQAVAIPGPVANPTPGSMVIRLNGKIWSEFMFGSSTGQQTPGAVVGGVPQGANKLAPYSMGTYLRLYPGVDGMATNGLRWGAQAEIRENFNGVGYEATPSSATTSITATNAQNSSATTATSGLTCEQTLYVRRAFVWVAQDQIGIFRFGQGDGVSGIFDNGIISEQNVGSGAWNGDLPAQTLGNDGFVYPWYSQQGAEYGSNKIVYLSPQFFGVDLGFDFAPNNGNAEFNCANASQLGCPNLSSSSQTNAAVTSPTDNFRFRNQTQLGARYQGVVGPVSILGFGDWIHSGVVNYTGPAIAGVPGSTYNGQSNGVNAGFVGLSVTFAGLQIAAGWQGGQYNSIMATPPKGAANANAEIIGGTYSIGPWQFGASYYVFDDQGAVALTGVTQRHGNYYAFDAAYQITPGILGYAGWLYATNHQGDYNFVTGASGSAFHNNAMTNGAIIGLLVGW
jgi:hypothetical protein